MVEFARTKRFDRNWKKLSPSIRTRALKALDFLLSDIRHPSLRAKIVDETERIWQIRANGGYRIYFQIEKGGYLLINIIPHPK